MERKYIVETFRLCISTPPDSPEVSAGTWFKLFTLFNKSKCLCQIPYSIFCFIHILLYSSFPVILNHNNHVTQTKCYADVNVPPANTIVTPLKGSHKVSQLKTNSLPESDSTLSRVTAPFTRSQMQSFLLVYLLVFWSSEVPSEFPLNYEVPWSYKTFQVPPANQFPRPKDYMCRLNHNVLISLALSTPLVFLFFLNTFLLIIWKFHTMFPDHTQFPFLPGLLSYLCATHPKYTMYSFYCSSGPPLRR